MSYLFGITQVSLPDYLIGNFGGMFFQSVYFYIGCTVTHFYPISDFNQLTNHGEAKTKILAVSFLEIAFAIIIGILVSYKAKRSLDEALEEDRRKREGRSEEELELNS